MRRSGSRGVLCLLPLLGAACATPTAPGWVEAFGYAAESLHSVRIGEFGFPFIAVGFGADTLWLPFDTGNMAGLTLEASRFEEQGLPCSERWNRLDSGGRLVGSDCVAHGVEVTVGGATRDSLSVLAFEHRRLPGLIGPGTLPGSRFTLDYEAGLLAVDRGNTDDAIPGFDPVPLVRSEPLPLLVIVWGRVGEHDVLIEIDTGKSRTTIDRRLVESLGLEETGEGVGVGTVRIGGRTWDAGTARVVDTSGISEGLPEPISLGIGSDLLADVVLTVDYVGSHLWLEGPDG